MCLSIDDTNMVDPDDACPLCGERRADMIEWIDDDRVRFGMCGAEYRPRPAAPE